MRIPSRLSPANKSSNQSGVSSIGFFRTVGDTAAKPTLLQLATGPFGKVWPLRKISLKQRQTGRMLIVQTLWRDSFRTAGSLPCGIGITFSFTTDF